MSISLQPKKSDVENGEEAWWYDGKGSISIYIQGIDKILSCRIKRSALERYLKRVSKAMKARQ